MAELSSCVDLERKMLKDPVDIRVAGVGLDFAAAQNLAWAMARGLKDDPMMMAWYIRGERRWSPPVECCGEDKPSWLIYAESRGADLAVSVNDEEYVFMFWGETKKRAEHEGE